MHSLYNNTIWHTFIPIILQSQCICVQISLKVKHEIVMKLKTLYSNQNEQQFFHDFESYVFWLEIQRNWYFAIILLSKNKQGLDLILQLDSHV